VATAASARGLGSNYADADGLALLLRILSTRLFCLLSGLERSRQWNELQPLVPVKQPLLFCLRHGYQSDAAA